VASKLAAIFYPECWPPEYLHGTLDELYRLRIYDGCHWRGKDSVVIDAGANIGQVTRALAPLAGHVYAIEADPDYYRILEINRRYNHWHNVSTHHLALTDQDGEVVLHRTAASPFAYSVAHDWGEETVTVPGRRLASFMEEQEIRQVDLLKLDIEGSEQALVSEASFAQVAPLIGSIVVECHFGSSQAVAQALARVGFVERRRLDIPSSTHMFLKRRGHALQTEW